MRLYFISYLSIYVAFFSCKKNNNSTAFSSLIIDERLVIVNKEYYEDGTLNIDETFLLDSCCRVRHGYEKWYFPNGSIRYSINYVKGAKIGSAHEYYSSEVLKKYRFYNPFGKLRYFVEFDDSGKIVEEKGKISPFTIYDYEKNHVEIYSPDLPKFTKALNLYGDNIELSKTFIEKKNLYSQINLKKLPNASRFKLVVQYSSKDTSFYDSLYLKNKNVYEF